MNAPTIDPTILAKAQTWLTGNFDEETKSHVQHLIDNDPTGLIDSFYQDLEFGTGGLRGIMGVGSNRMNKYTVGMATQGLANYLKKIYPNEQIKMAIATDSRNNNKLFSSVIANVLSANDILVYVFDDIRPTPELSYTVRFLGCHAGIVVTASHNPKEYNGYKVYGKDGGQLVAPHDKNVITEVQKIKGPDDVNFNAKAELIKSIGADIDAPYLAEIKKLSQIPELITKHSDLKIVFTPLHGTGVKLVPQALTSFGFKNIISVEEQNIPDGNFPTIKSPNPEEKSALAMAIEKAKSVDADLVLATDPDADRVGIAVKNNVGEFVLLNGNETITLLLNYIIKQWKAKGKLHGNEFVVKTIVTTDILEKIAKQNNIEIFNVLTGFKFIAEIIKKYEGVKTFVAGGEESYGYLFGDFVRDKDAVSACCMIAETAVWAKDNGQTLYDMLIDIYLQYGVYKEGLVNVVKQGKAGADAINQMMLDYRTTPPTIINNSNVIRVLDYQEQTVLDVASNTKKEMKEFPKSNVLQFFLADGTKISVRPSGTEPKIKFYIGVQQDLTNKQDFSNVTDALIKKIDAIKASMKL